MHTIGLFTVTSRSAIFPIDYRISQGCSQPRDGFTSGAVLYLWRFVIFPGNIGISQDLAANSKFHVSV